MSAPDDKRPEPWYRQFWPWFLIALPAAAVAASMVTIYLATSRPHAMVVDDYAKIGLTIQRKQERDQRAAELGVRAQIDFGPVADEVVVTLDADTPPTTEHLFLTLSHPTRADRDRRIEMAGARGRYRGRLSLPADSRWYVQIEPADRSWRLAGELPRGELTLRLAPANMPTDMPTDRPTDRPTDAPTGTDG